MARPLKTDAKDTHRLILDAALDLFSQGGYAGASMRQLARAVGVRESALYHHFESKEAILRALLDELGPGQSRQLDAIDVPAMVKQLKGGKAFLKLIGRTLVELWATPKEQKIARLMMGEGHRLTALGVIDPRKEIGLARSRMQRVIGELIALEKSPVDPADATTAFMGPLIMLRALHLVMASGPPDLAAFRRDVDRHVDFFWRAVSKT